MAYVTIMDNEVYDYPLGIPPNDAWTDNSPYYDLSGNPHYFKHNPEGSDSLYTNPNARGPAYIVTDPKGQLNKNVLFIDREVYSRADVPDIKDQKRWEMKVSSSPYYKQGNSMRRSGVRTTPGTAPDSSTFPAEYYFIGQWMMVDDTMDWWQLEGPTSVLSGTYLQLHPSSKETSTSRLRLRRAGAVGSRAAHLEYRSIGRYQWMDEVEYKNHLALTTFLVSDGSRGPEFIVNPGEWFAIVYALGLDWAQSNRAWTAFWMWKLGDPVPTSMTTPHMSSRNRNDKNSTQHHHIKFGIYWPGAATTQKDDIGCQDRRYSAQDLFIKASGDRYNEGLDATFQAMTLTGNPGPPQQTVWDLESGGVDLSGQTFTRGEGKSVNAIQIAGADFLRASWKFDGSTQSGEGVSNTFDPLTVSGGPVLPGSVDVEAQIFTTAGTNVTVSKPVVVVNPPASGAVRLLYETFTGKTGDIAGQPVENRTDERCTWQDLSALGNLSPSVDTNDILFTRLNEQLSCTLYEGYIEQGTISAVFNPGGASEKGGLAIYLATAGAKVVDATKNEVYCEGLMISPNPTGGGVGRVRHHTLNHREEDGLFGYEELENSLFSQAFPSDNDLLIEVNFDRLALTIDTKITDYTNSVLWHEIATAVDTSAFPRMRVVGFINKKQTTGWRLKQVAVDVLSYAGTQGRSGGGL